MAITTKASNLEVSRTGDNFSVSATVQLLDGIIVLAESVITVNGFRYEADDLKVSIKSKFQDAIKQWKQQLAGEQEIKTLLSDLVGELCLAKL